ncbi:nucleotidyl transferase AbiEii/AbiGii toxin family protein [Roseomonas sp. E05]|uniref:nucleotidyl transferase AbiEii/AbiGii toxin family protein n=1 Tax=Roseomonas sp. E05 TaxID=3046310 RepID=UPI0024BBAA84|nr:nucleotidyl transferase AbiEii/AbiGii toxin family protein [Roseomonas sp. E05]MDJ0390078.1 nucleotidyl transferase AbiEii/AbiGii toxin family protein [Roseomonas sp. E05]
MGDPDAQSGWSTHRRDLRAVARILDALAGSGPRDTVAVRGAWCFQCWFGRMPRLTRGLDLAMIPSVDEMAPTARNVLAGLMARDIGVGEPRVAGDGWTARTTADLRILCGDKWVPVHVSVAHDVADHRHVEFLRAPTCNGATACLVPCLTRDWLVAEKAALLVTYGPDHTRLQDIFDICVLQACASFEATALASVFARVFSGRDAATMLRRSDGYWEAALDRRRLGRAQFQMWEAIAGSAEGAHSVPGLPQALDQVADFLLPLLEQLRAQRQPSGSWRSTSGWVRQHRQDWCGDLRQLSLLAQLRTPRARQVGPARVGIGSPGAAAHLRKRHAT